jgi:membrane-associated protease RseP (regulator of RpoE activity)
MRAYTLIATVIASALLAAFAPALGLTIIALLVVVTIHEGGHFLAARSMKLHTPEFAVGIGPKVLSRQGRDTEWTLRAIPLGGFVRIAGMGNTAMDSAAADDIPAGKRSWETLNRAQRAYLAFAGPFANFCLAVVLIGSVLFALGMPTDDLARVSPTANSPAAAAGVKDGDIVLSVNGEQAPTFAKMRELTAELKPNVEVPTVVSRNGEQVELLITPKVTDGRTVLGVQSAPVFRTPSPWELVSNTAFATRELGSATLSGIAQLGNAVVSIPAQIIGGEAADPEKRLLSPIGAARVAEEYKARDGWYAPFALLAASSMFIGAFNLLPIPPLDGGHIAIAAYEGIASRVRRRRVVVDLDKLAPFIRAAVSLILLIGVSSLVLDVIDPVMLP